MQERHRKIFYTTENPGSSTENFSTNKGAISQIYCAPYQNSL